MSWRLFSLMLVMLCGSVAPVIAQDRQILGFGRIFSNDYLGDGQDRWRTGSYTAAVVQGFGWDGTLPDQMGRLLDYRLHTEIIAPNPTGPLGRPYAGIVSLGVVSHSSLGPLEYAAGIDLVLVGPQTGLSDFQQGFHDAFSMPAPRGIRSQLPDAAYLGGMAELVWPVALSDRITLRPFAEVHAGAEDLYRAGADLVIGPAGASDLWLRDVTTGQLFRGIAGGQTGMTLILGADFTQVNNSAFLPASSGYVARERRTRARAGVMWQFAPQSSLFYGLTWLSPEFEGQAEGQVLGSLTLNFNF